MKEINGDLIKLALAGEFNLIAHGCNCRGNMGKGIAKQIKEHFPKVAKIDKGGELPGTIFGLTYPNGLTVINAYTQINWGRANEEYSSSSPINNHSEPVYDTQSNRYRFIRSCMKSIKSNFSNKKIGLPLIGCGLAGGDWAIVKEIIKEELAECDYTIVHYAK